MNSHSSSNLCLSGSYIFTYIPPKLNIYAKPINPKTNDLIPYKGLKWMVLQPQTLRSYRILFVRYSELWWKKATKILAVGTWHLSRLKDPQVWTKARVKSTKAHRSLPNSWESDPQGIWTPEHDKHDGRRSRWDVNSSLLRVAKMWMIHAIEQCWTCTGTTSTTSTAAAAAPTTTTTTTTSTSTSTSTSSTTTTTTTIFTI